jgi:hypothetical protein
MDVGHRRNTLFFDYGAISFIDEHAIRYQYYLEGFDDTWLDEVPATTRRARYTNLPPGRYRFHLRAVGMPGTWSEPVSSQWITIRKPIWSTWWFFLLTGALVFQVGVWAYAAASRRWTTPTSGSPWPTRGGIPPDALGKVFDPYYTTKEKGSGLGLATAYAIARGHGGVIAVQSSPGKGALFRVSLPAAPDAVVPDRGEKQALLHGPGRVLVMDDEQQILEFSDRILARLGYQAVTAVNGARPPCTSSRSR